MRWVILLSLFAVCHESIPPPLVADACFAWRPSCLVGIFVCRALALFAVRVCEARRFLIVAAFLQLHVRTHRAGGINRKRSVALLRSQVRGLLTLASRSRYQLAVTQPLNVDDGGRPVRSGEGTARVESRALPAFVLFVVQDSSCGVLSAPRKTKTSDDLS